MDQFVELLRRSHMILYVCSCIIMLYCGFRRAENGTVPDSPQNEQKMDPLLRVLNILSTLTVIGVVFGLFFCRKIVWPLFILLIPFFLQFASGMLVSTNAVGHIVRSANEKKLSFGDRTTIIAFAGIIGVIEYSSKSGQWIRSMHITEAGYLYDFCVFVDWTWRIYVYTFLHSALLAISSQLLLKLIQRMILKISPRWRKYIICLYQRSEDPSRKVLWTHKYCAFAKEKKRGLRRVLCILIPLILIIDFLVNILNFIFAIATLALVHSLIILWFVGKAVYKLIEIFGGTSDRKIVVLSSRIAVISTLSALVILNRIDPIFVNVEPSTAILEFVASAIIIPVVFEWINSAQTTRGTKDC